MFEAGAVGAFPGASAGDEPHGLAAVPDVLYERLERLQGEALHGCGVVGFGRCGGVWGGRVVGRWGVGE